MARMHQVEGGDNLGRYLLAGGLVVALGLAMGYRPAGGAAGVLAATALVLLFASALSRQPGQPPCVTATRTLMADTATTPQILWAVASSGVLIAVFAPLTALLYQRR